MVGVVGGHSCSDEVARVAFEVGKAVADSGHTLVCGGLTGVMYHACKGAKSAGGTTVGILPTTSKSDANPYVDIAIPTGIGLARNMIVVLASDVIVAIDGSFGTLSEIAYALQFRKPVFGLGTWSVSSEIVALNDVAELIPKLQTLGK